MNVKHKSDICKLILKGYFAQAKDKIKNTNADVNQTEENKRTPLILCSFIEDSSWAVSLAQLLLEMGANINHGDTSQMNVLHYCVIFEQVDLLKLLLESIDFDINKGDCHGNSPLLYAIVTENDMTINLFIQYYQRFQIDFEKSNSRGINSFMQACLRGNIDLIEQLEKIGINENSQDHNGKTALSYKSDAIVKWKLRNQVNECRRQSRMVRFDDIVNLTKLQQESLNLKSNSQNLPDIIDENFDLINQLKTTLKKLKQNKIDMFYMNKNHNNSDGIYGQFLFNNHLKIQKIRPQTAFFTSKDLLKQNNWYSLIGPLCISLEQQQSSSFKRFPKSETTNNDCVDSLSDKSKGKQRKLSRSIGSHSRRNSIASRATIIDDSSDNASYSKQPKKKIENIVSTKMLSRNISRVNPNNSPS